MSFRTSLAAATATAIAVVTLGLVAPAAASTPPVIISPTDGGTLTAGTKGPLVIDFPTAGDYSVTVECGDVDDDDWYHWFDDGDGWYSGRQSFSIDPLVGWDDDDLTGKKCDVEVFSWDTYDATSTTFTVKAPPLSLGDVRATKTTFYPIVRDKYLDETAFRFRLNRKAKTTLTVTNSKGRTVYRKVDRSGGAGAHRWSWKGRTNAGKTVQPGKYRGTVTATADGKTVSKSTTLRVATKVVTRRTTLRKGYLSGRDSAKGNCHTSFSNYTETTTLDCWGGVFAATTFTFKVPANAKILSWRASTERNSLDKCCRGSITKHGDRASKKKFRVRVQVTGWRAVDVSGARVTYKSRVRI